MQRHGTVFGTIALIVALASAALFSQACQEEHGVTAYPCQQIDCESGSLACCVPALPGVWDPAVGVCQCLPPPDPDAAADVEPGADADADADVDPDTAADAPPEGIEDDASGDLRGAYPSGPYGLNAGNTFRNYSFLTGTGRITMQDVRLDRANTILFVYLGSASCTWCSTETPELNTIYEAMHPRGLEIFGVLADDSLGAPTGASADEYFGDRYGAQYPYGANAWSGVTLMSELYPDGSVALPENFIIDLDTMRILERMDGYPETGGLAPLIEPYL